MSSSRRITREVYHGARLVVVDKKEIPSRPRARIGIRATGSDDVVHCSLQSKFANRGVEIH